MTTTVIVNRQALARRIARLVKASLDYSWSGGGDPADMPEIERELKLAKRELDRFLRAGEVRGRTQRIRNIAKEAGL